MFGYTLALTLTISLQLQFRLPFYDSGHSCCCCQCCCRCCSRRWKCWPTPAPAKTVCNLCVCVCRWLAYFLLTLLTLFNLSHWVRNYNNKLTKRCLYVSRRKDKIKRYSSSGKEREWASKAYCLAALSGLETNNNNSKTGALSELIFVK